MRMWLLRLVCGFALGLQGCGPPKIDTTTEETTKASVQRVKDALPEAERKRFEDALTVVAFAGAGSLADMVRDPEGVKTRGLASLNGRTATEVLAEADRILEGRRLKEREQAAKEIADLEAKKATSAAAEAGLAKFTVTKSRFFKRKSMFSEDPVIELSVTNGTTSAISRAYFNGVVATPGRSVPWIKEDFSYSIPGGLEPGETASWSLAPNRFSSWGTDVPGDAVMTVVVTRLDGPDGKPLFEVAFSEKDAKRLDALREGLEK